MIRHRLTDEQWEQIENVFPPPGGMGRPTRDRRDVVDGILWILRTGSPWRDLHDALVLQRHLGFQDATTYKR